MLISKKRHRRELDQAQEESRRLTEEILGCASDGICLVDEDDQVLALTSRSFCALFGRRDCPPLSFSKLLTSVLPADTVAAALEHMKILRTTENVAEIRAANPLAGVRARLLNADGSFATRYLSFSFRRSNLGSHARTLIVVVSDTTESVMQARELEELREYSSTQSMCLSSLVRLGAERFAAFLQRTDSAMTTINLILKKPARESAAFQDKLQEILIEIRRIAADAQASRLDGIEKKAAEFEHSLQALCRREILSGTDFLPLAAQLDQLFAQLALMRSLSTATRGADLQAVLKPADSVMPARVPGQVTESGTQIIAAPRFDMTPDGEFASLAQVHTPPAGSMESTLLALTDHLAQSAQRSVTLHCDGLESIPERYQSLVKNISIQLIRNAVKHGIETPEERIAAGKLAFGRLGIEFRCLVDGRCDLTFEDDGRGLDAAGMRESAVAHGLISAEEARNLPDRQAIKLLFKAGVSAGGEAQAASQRGLRMATVRRLVSEADGRIALSTVPGRQTRFKISLPSVSEGATRVA